ncbi:MAG: hypothetical protein HOO19_17055 [Rhodospirillaceae bacterium]|nr:hypothetical protein [Rhodospirillaceae bacterium]MBT4751047.1 hypothetical protein [Rhodospirillaceae bacterium]
MMDVYEPKFDQPEYTKDARRYYLICSAPRTGSSYLCELLIASGVMGVPAEYFNNRSGIRRMTKNFGIGRNGHVPMERYIELLKKHRTTANGLFGAKIQHWQIGNLTKAKLISKHFPGAKFIHLTRADILAQIVSHNIAVRTGNWNSMQGHEALELDRQSLRKSAQFICEERAAWDYFFAANQIDPLHIRYEDLETDRDSVIAKLFDFVGVETDFDFLQQPTALRRQRSQINADWIDALKSDAGY